MVVLKILTLNCWGLPVGTQRKDERMAAIIQQLQKAEYDIVVLQEIWLQKDFMRLKAKLDDVYSHNHYWRSGFTGSGVCIFSKHVILETFSHPFPLSGYPHKFQHCDFYAGKSVSFARIQVGEFKVNVFGIHQHAGYGLAYYQYQQLLQAFHLSQFVKLTSDSCDAVFVAGDFNLLPDNLGYKVIKANANLQDAWLATKASTGHPFTCDSPSNPFTPSSKQGECLDYILFRNNCGVELVCNKCELTMGRVPGESFHYSDHEGVGAEFMLRKSLTAPAVFRDSSLVEEHLRASVQTLDNGITRVKRTRVCYVVAMLLLLLLGACAQCVLPAYLTLLIHTIITVMLCYGVWSVVILQTVEINSFTASINDINNILRYNTDIIR